MIGHSRGRMESRIKKFTPHCVCILLSVLPPFLICDLQVPALSKEYTAIELGHGKKLFQLRAADPAGNVGEAAEYIWFVDLATPTAAFTQTPSRYTRTGKVQMAWASQSQIT